MRVVFSLCLGDLNALNNLSLHMGIYCLFRFKTMDIYKTHSYLNPIFRLSMFWTNMSKTWHNSPVLHLSEGTTTCQASMVELPPSQKNQQKKHNFLSYSCWRIFQMITSFFEAVAWFFPFVGIILIIYFPVPWAKNLRPFDWVQPKKTGAIFMEQKLRPGWHQLSKKVIKGAFLSKSILGSWLILLVHEHFMSSEGVLF